MLRKTLTFTIEDYDMNFVDLVQNLNFRKENN